MASAIHRILVTLLASLAMLLAPANSHAAQPRSYWLVSSTGQVFSEGPGTRAFGSEFHKRFRGRIIGIKATPDHKGRGYWIVTSRTHYSYGDARRYKYRAGGLRRYRGRQHPKGLKGRIVGYAIANIPATKKHEGGGGSRTTPTGTTTTTTPSTTTPPTSTAPATTTPTSTTPAGTTTAPSAPTVDCSHLAIATSSLNKATATEPYSQILSADGVSGGNWTWTIKSGSLPAGLSLSSGGTITGTPTQSTAGTQTTVALQAINSQCPGSPASKTFTLMIAALPMSITTSSLPNDTYGQPYPTTTLSATGGDGQYVWTAFAGMPPGLSLSAGGVLSGTPTGIGTYSGVGIELSDASGATGPVYGYYTITISAPPLQITSPTSLSDGQAKVAYPSVQFTGSGGWPGDTKSDYTWSATGLPAGMSMSWNGILSGTPTTQGNYTAAVTLTDTQDANNAANHITQNYSLHVGYAPLQFTTTTLTAIQGQSYTGQVIAQGGEAPYNMKLISGSLPAGMSFDNGTITVEPTVASGDYQFTLGLTDSASDPAPPPRTFNMWVAPSETTPDLTVGGSPQNGSGWGGYVEQASTAFTSVSGTFTVATIQATPDNEIQPWVGIDGWGDGSVIQAGVTASTTTNGQPTYEAWWDTYPSPIQNQFAVKPGETINVNVWQISTGTWEITLNDVTSGQGFATQVSYTGNGDTTAEWIVEEASTQPGTGYGATTVFSNMAANQAGTGMMEVTSANEIPGTLTGNGFTLTQY